MRIIASALALLIVSACGDALVEELRADGGKELADAAELDASQLAEDAAVPHDAGATEDAGAGADAGSFADAGTADAAEPTGVVQYTADRVHSPMTPDLASRLSEIAARGAGLHPDVFAKVGDSNTVNTNFLNCFAGTHVDLAGHDALQATLDHFNAGDAGGSSPFARSSLAATVGWSAWAVLAGDPSPLDQEVAAISPGQAVVLYGTNDIQAHDLARFARDMLGIVDRLIEQGVVPHVTSVPPRDDNPDADAWVPRYSAVARGVAQARGVPFLDLEKELRPLPDHGIGPDGLHLTTYVQQGSQRGCILTAEALRYGFNVRNLLTLESLDRALAVLHRGAAAPDADAPRLAGAGTAENPFVVASLPFSDWRDTRREGEPRIDHYEGCAASQDESGRELTYRLEVTQPITLRAQVYAQGGADVDVHLLAGSPEGSACVARNDQVVTAALTPGTWFVVLDTYVSAGQERAGEYLVTMVAE